MRRLILTCLLLGALLAMPYNAEPADPNPKPQSIVAVLCGILILVGGTVIIWSLWKLCKKLPPIEDYGSTNAPPAPPVRPWTNITIFPAAAHTVVMADPDLHFRSISNAIPPDTNGAFVSPWTHYCEADLEASPDLVLWQPVMTITGWFSSAGCEMVFVTNGCAFSARYFPATNGSFTGQVPFEAVPPGVDRRFFRFHSH